MDKSEKIQKEVEKLKEIFKDCDQSSLKLIDGLIFETAFLTVELSEMRKILNDTGMIKIHPTDFTKQKPLPIANEYRRTLNIYSLNIKVLNSILRNIDGIEDDAFSVWLKDQLVKDKKEKHNEL